MAQNQEQYVIGKVFHTKWRRIRIPWHSLCQPDCVSQCHSLCSFELPTIQLYPATVSPSLDQVLTVGVDVISNVYELL